MSTIRNLSAAPSFGTSPLDAGGGNKARRTRSDADEHERSSSLLTSRTFSQLGVSSAADSRSLRRSLATMPSFGGGHHHQAGEVIGSSSFASHQKRFSLRPRFHTEDASDTISLSPRPHRTSLTPPQFGRMNGVRKRRSSTWDAGTGKLSPMTRMNKSNSLDNNDIPSSASGGSESLSSDQEGEKRRSDMAQFRFESVESDLYDSESGSDYDSEFEETKTYEYETDDTHDVETQQDLNPPNAAMKRESRLSQVGDVDSGISANVATEIKGIFRDSSHSTVKSDPAGKSVRFSDDVAENDEEIEPDSRPSFCAKLPALTQWEDSSEDAETSFRSPPRRNSDSTAHFQRQNSEPSRLERLGEALNPFGDLSWSLIGSCIVRAAPCFWFSKKLRMSATDRELLLRLNILNVFFCIVQIIFGIGLLVADIYGVVEHSVETTQASDDAVTVDLWSLDSFVYGLSIISLVLLVASIRAQRAIREVNLVGSVRFMWVLFWLVPLQILFMIGLFDYFNVNSVKTKHWWDDPSMVLPREYLCAHETAHTKCIVPIAGGINFTSEEEWCQFFYKSTDCEEIRDEAQLQYEVASTFFYTLNAIWALVLVVLMWVTLCVVQAIITLSIVQRSKESNIPIWLTIPIIGCYGVGYLLRYSRGSLTEAIGEIRLMAITYLLSGGAFTIAALVGIFLRYYTVLNGRQRRIKQGVVILFIATLVLTLFSVGAIFITSLIYSLNILDLPFGTYEQIACIIDLSGSCTGCRDVPQTCPEWEESEVQDVLMSVMKQSASLAAIFLVYALITLRYGFLLFRYVSRYQIEYV